MVVTFLYGALVGALVGWAGWHAWKRLPAPVAALAGVAGAAAVIAAITEAAHLGVHLAGAGDVIALILGLVGGGALADALPSRRTGSGAR